jgi:uncharacterized protein Yka (UPF0111/DUF47 family)
MAALILNILKPQKKLFFNLFEEVSTNLQEIVQVFTELISESDYYKRKSINDRIILLQKDNEVLTHRIFVELSKNYVTPFDREDIYGLAKSIQSIADHLHLISKKIHFYKVNPTDGDGLKALTLSVTAMIRDITDAVKELRNFKNVKSIIDHVKDVEVLNSDVQETFHICMERLFEDENDLKELIKRREIFKLLETVAFKGKECSTYIEAIVIKYG